MRTARTPATSVLNSIVPLLSLIGLHAFSAARANFFNSVSSTLVPISALEHSSTQRTFGATAPSATRASVIITLSKRKLTPHPTTAISMSVLGMNLK